MTCTHKYPNKHCVDCMVARIKSLRSPDAKTSRMVQNQLFAYMPLRVAEEVKARLRAEK